MSTKKAADLGHDSIGKLLFQLALPAITWLSTSAYFICA